MPGQRRLTPVPLGWGWWSRSDARPRAGPKRSAEPRAWPPASEARNTNEDRDHKKKGGWEGKKEEDTAQDLGRASLGWPRVGASPITCASLVIMMMNTSHAGPIHKRARMDHVVGARWNTLALVFHWHAQRYVAITGCPANDACATRLGMVEP